MSSVMETFLELMRAAYEQSRLEYSDRLNRRATGLRIKPANDGEPKP